MKYWTSIFLLALSTVFPSTSFNVFVPADQELIYNYRAFFKAGALTPKSFASECFLHAELKIQPSNNSILAQLSNLTYRLYNGQRYHGHEHDAQELSIPDEATDLLNTFKVVYNSNGQAEGIVTEQEETTQARNIHKALAAIFQLHAGNILTVKDAHGETSTFITEERSVHGKTLSSYVVQNAGEIMSVKKMQEAIANVGPVQQEAFPQVTTNINLDHCEARFEEPISRNAHQTYVITKQDGRLLVNLLKSSGGIYVYPFEFQSEGQYVYAQVTLDLIQVKPIGKPLKVNVGLFEEDLTYQMVDDCDSPDVEQLVAMLEEIVVKKQRPPLGRPDQKLINQMVQLLRNFDQATLEKMHLAVRERASGKCLEVYHQLLPLVGSHASMVYVKTIIGANLLDEDTALHMLQELPFNARAPNEKTLQDLEPMLTWGETVTVKIREAAVLAFATLIGKVLRQQRIPLHDTPNKYIDDLGRKLQSMGDSASQILYIQALQNTKSPLITKYLSPIIKGRSTMGHRTRLVALWAAAPVATTDSNLAFELYWPIFNNHTQRAELRITAYYVIMKSRPSAARLLNIFWEMQGTPSADLYHFYYTYLMAMSRTTDPCHEATRLHAAQFIKFTPKPQRAWSTYRQMDYVDEKYKFGETSNLFFIAGDSSVMIRVESHSQMFNVRWNDYGYWIKIDGLDQKIWNKLRLNLDITGPSFNYQELWKLISTNIQDTQIWVMVERNSQVVQIYHYDHNSIQNFSLSKLLEEFCKSSITIRYEALTEIVLPTEMGIPAVVEISVPAIYHKRLNITKEVLGGLINFQLDNHYHVLRQAHYGISLYNPVLRVWQGSNRHHSYDLNLALLTNVTIDTQQQVLRILTKKHQNQDEDFISLKSHVTTKTFIRDDYQRGLLEKSCSTCQNSATVTKGHKYRQNYTLYQDESKATGYGYKLAVYDSEIEPTGTNLQKIFDKLTSSRNKNYQSPLGYLTLLLRHWHALVVLQPPPGTHGLLFEAQPSTQIDLTLQITTTNFQQHEHPYLPGFQLNPRITYAVKNQEQVTTWDLNATIDVNPGHTTRNFNVEISRTKPELNDYKIWIKSAKFWTKEGVHGHATLTTSNNDSSIKISMVGLQGSGQKLSGHSYKICQPYSDLGPDYYSMSCAAAHTSVRNYSYDVTTKNLASWFAQIVPDVSVGSEQNLRVFLEYTMADEVSLRVAGTPFYYQLEGMPLKDLSYWKLYPDNTHHSKFYTAMHHVGLTDVCVVKSDLIPHEYLWTMCVGDLEENPSHGVYVMKISGTRSLAFRATRGNLTLEVNPAGDHNNQFEILVDGHLVDHTMDYCAEDWFSYLIRPHVHGFIVTLFDLQLHVEYTPKQVVIEIPKVRTSVQLYGHCIEKILS